MDSQMEGESTSASADGLLSLAGLPERYETKEILGQGGMGMVFHAYDRQLQRDVAIKILSGEISEEFRSRFLREAKALASLDHPNICKIHSSGITENGLPYHAVEFISGETLAQELKRTKTLSAQRFGKIILQVLAGLGHAHAQKIVHRDLKPGNIMISQDGDANPVVKLIDFGIARIEAASGEHTKTLTKTNALLGSPTYMSPEQCKGLDITKQSDIYSLACIMYECIAGNPPFTADSSLELMYKHLNEKAPELQSMAKDKNNRRLAALIDKCLSKNPAERIQSTEDLEKELNSIFVELKELDSFSRRDKYLIALAGALLLASLTAAAFWLSQSSSQKTSQEKQKIIASKLPVRIHSTSIQADRLEKQLLKKVFEIKNSKARLSEEDDVSLVSDANRYANKVLELCGPAEMKKKLGRAEQVLSDVIALSSVKDEPAIIIHIKRGKIRMLLNKFTECKADFDVAFAMTDRQWGDVSQIWIDVYLQYLPYLIRTENFVQAGVGIDKVTASLVKFKSHDKKFIVQVWSSSQFLEQNENALSRLELVQEAARQVDAIHAIDTMQRKQKIMLCLKMLNLFAVLNHNSPETLATAKKTMRELPPGDPDVAKFADEIKHVELTRLQLPRQ